VICGKAALTELCSRRGFTAGHPGDGLVDIDGNLFGFLHVQPALRDPAFRYSHQGYPTFVERLTIGLGCLRVPLRPLDNHAAH